MKRLQDREKISRLVDIPNIGKAIAAMLEEIEITNPSMLVGRDAYKLHEELCTVKKQKIDNCVIDVFLSAIYFMEGAPARPWYYYTKERKEYKKKQQ